MNYFVPLQQNKNESRMENLKIAFLKQEIYQDLYVCPVTEQSAANILFSSMFRVGPIGLFSELNADFYIIQEEYAPETQIYRVVIPYMYDFLQKLKTTPVNQIPGHERKKPGSPYPNGKFAIKADTVNWGQYDIVISVNVSLPAHIVKQYPHTLFAYMVGEANMATHKVRFGYDVTLNQKARGIIAERCGEVDFPYTFVNDHSLENIMHETLGRPSRKQGVFVEINSSTERPVVKMPPQFQPLADIGQNILLHHESIRENLATIYDSKYFVKMGGRPIRGNSVIEAISLGSLAIMDRSEVIHGELIIDECNVRNMDEAVALIKQLEALPVLYEQLLEKERAVLRQLFYEAPLQSLINCLNDKRTQKKLHPYTWMERKDDEFYILWCRIKNRIKLIQHKMFK